MLCRAVVLCTGWHDCWRLWRAPVCSSAWRICGDFGFAETDINATQTKDVWEESYVNAKSAKYYSASGPDECRLVLSSGARSDGRHCRRVARSRAANLPHIVERAKGTICTVAVEEILASRLTRPDADAGENRGWRSLVRSRCKVFQFLYHLLTVTCMRRVRTLISLTKTTWTWRPSPKISVAIQASVLPYADVTSFVHVPGQRCTASLPWHHAARTEAVLMQSWRSFRASAFAPLGSQRGDQTISTTHVH